jgi:hypothetical protein
MTPSTKLVQIKVAIDKSIHDKINIAKENHKKE